MNANKSEDLGQSFKFGDKVECDGFKCIVLSRRPDLVGDWDNAWCEMIFILNENPLITAVRNGKESNLLRGWKNDK